MREIKFRAWDGERYIMPPKSHDSILGNHGFTLDGRCYIDGVFQDFTLEQYTGINDKNGVEIYEGDIIVDPAFGSESMLTVGFDKGAFMCSGPSEEWPLLMDHVEGVCKVVGNIHEEAK